jgi:hypothetical protein
MVRHPPALGLGVDGGGELGNGASTALIQDLGAGNAAGSGIAAAAIAAAGRLLLDQLAGCGEREP